MLIVAWLFRMLAAVVRFYLSFALYSAVFLVTFMLIVVIGAPVGRTNSPGNFSRVSGRSTCFWSGIWARFLTCTRGAVAWFARVPVKSRAAAILAVYMMTGASPVKRWVQPCFFTLGTGGACVVQVYLNFRTTQGPPWKKSVQLYQVRSIKWLNT